MNLKSLCEHLYDNRVETARQEGILRQSVDLTGFVVIQGGIKKSREPWVCAEPIKSEPF